MANRMAEIAKLLGVEVGEVFQVDGDPSIKDCFFKFSDNDLQLSAVNGDNDTWGVANDSRLLGLLYGSLSIRKLPWKPKINEVYYYPIVDLDYLYCNCEWRGEDTDYHRLNNGLVFKTREEAIEMVMKMLEIARGNIQMTKSRMKGIAMLFGIELGEVFHIRNAKCAINDDFKFTEEGLMRSSWTSNVWKTAKAVDLKYLLNGTYSIIKLWKPNFGERYYVPHILYRDLWDCYSWDDEEYDEELYKRGVVFKTKEEAVMAAKKMLETAKELRE